MKWGKWFSKIFVMSILAAVILGILGMLIESITALSISWGYVISLLATIIIFAFAVRFNPGKENMIDYLPILAIVIAIIATVGILWETSPLSFIVEFTVPGLMLGLSAVFLASGITAKIIK